MKFIKREIAPSKDDKHYYSNNIFYKSGYGMPNCTAYAWGRFYELMEQLGIEGVPKLQTSNAENWYTDEKNYEKGQTPKLGAVAVWSKGKYHVSEDGAGHVAIVEEIYPDGSWLASNSAWKGKEFYLTKHNKNGDMNGYKFEGFIYLPKEFDNSTPEKNETQTFEEGDLVFPKSLVNYNGIKMKAYRDWYTITELVRDRAVLSTENGVWGAFNTNNLILVKKVNTSEEPSIEEPKEDISVTEKDKEIEELKYQISELEKQKEEMINVINGQIETIDSLQRENTLLKTKPTQDIKQPTYKATWNIEKDGYYEVYCTKGEMIHIE